MLLGIRTIWPGAFFLVTLIVSFFCIAGVFSLSLWKIHRQIEANERELSKTYWYERLFFEEEEREREKEKNHYPTSLFHVYFRYDFELHCDDILRKSCPINHISAR